MLKKKFLLLFYFFPIITALAFTVGNFKTKFTSNQSENSISNNISILSYDISKTVICKGVSSKNVVIPELWSNPATWSGSIPVAGAMVVIPSNKHIILDVSPPALSGLTIEGVLEFAPQNLNLTSQWIMVMGRLKIGSVTAPFAQKATITLNGTDMNYSEMGMGNRGLMIMGGILELHGTPPTKTWTKINEHAPQGTTNLSLMEAVNWQVNDQIVVAPTDYMGTGNTQRTTINAINGNSLTTSAGMNAQRWGLMQYATSTGMSLTYSPPPASVVAGTPTELDERAEVGNLTRNIVIQSPDDVLWRNSGFGCHIMVMRNGNTNGVAHINGIEIKRGGQNGRLARYPFHWHMLSYNGTTTLPDATGQYIRNSTVNESAQRGIVIHGTNGVEVSKNVLFDIKGHGIFTEDASERRNIINGNLVLHIRNPITALKVHEGNNSVRGSSGFWISNPDNIITNNVVADSGATGFWFAFTTKAWGASSGIIMNPRRMLFGVFDNNTAHSNGREGVYFDDVEIDNNGNTMGSTYVATTDGLDPVWPYPNQVRHMLSRYTTYKNAGHGIWNRSWIPDNDQVVSADNCNSFFSGAGTDGLIKRSLVVGNSLNYNMNGMQRPTTFGADFPVAMASYHSTFDLKENFILNFPANAGSPSGAFNLSDYYLVPVDKGMVRNINNTLVNSHPGVRSMPSELFFTLATLWDPYDNWGGSVSQDNYYVFNTPFFTHGQTPTIVAPNAAISGGVVVVGPFYGVADFVVNKGNSPYYPLMQIDVNRLNNSLATVGSFSVAEGTNGGLLANMRHFSTHPTGIYDLDFPTLQNVNDIAVNISNMLTDNDYQVIGMEYNGNYQINGLFTSRAYNYMDFGGSVPLPSTNSETHVYQLVSNISSVINSPTGEVFWQDRINNKVWFKVRGGLNPGNGDLSPNADFNLYKNFNLRVYGTFAPLSVNSYINLNEKSLHVFPNPSSSEITVKWDNMNLSNEDLTIANTLGQTVYTKKTSQSFDENSQKINVNNWSKGIYFIKLKQQTVKFIKK